MIFFRVRSRTSCSSPSSSKRESSEEPFRAFGFFTVPRFLLPFRFPRFNCIYKDTLGPAAPEPRARGSVGLAVGGRLAGRVELDVLQGDRVPIVGHEIEGDGGGDVVRDHAHP